MAMRKCAKIPKNIYKNAKTAEKCNMNFQNKNQMSSMGEIEKKALKRWHKGNPSQLSADLPFRKTLFDSA